MVGYFAGPTSVLPVGPTLLGKTVSIKYVNIIRQILIQTPVRMPITLLSSFYLCIHFPSVVEKACKNDVPNYILIGKGDRRSMYTWATLHTLHYGLKLPDILDKPLHTRKFRHI